MARWLRGLALDRPGAFAWAMYDWANSAFILTVVTTIFPAYFLELSAGELDENQAQQKLIETTRNALIIIALSAPLIGALADVKALKKTLLAIFMLVGVVATGSMFLLMPGDWHLGLILFGLANIGAAGSIVSYDALLPHVATREEVDQLSTSGYALGYLGSGLLLLLNFAWIMRPAWFGLPHGDGLSVEEQTLPTRLAFLSVAVWWGVFTLPLLIRVPEPAPTPLVAGDSRSAFLATLRRLVSTFRELRSHREACKMLVAFLIYNDGIATLIRMAAIYGLTQGVGKMTVFGSILVLQFVGIPFAILFGRFGSRYGSKRMILVGVFVYGAISIVAYFMSADWHFVVLALMVGTVQGGTQGLSRSLFASMIPHHQSGEYFALFAVGEKFAGIFGPLVFGVVMAVTGTAQNAILSIVAFFVVGGLVLMRVDVEAGRAGAREAERLAAA